MTPSTYAGRTFPQSAVFLDRDGTLIEEVGYLDRPERVQLYPWSADAIRALNRADIRVVMVTNQSGIARGFFTEDTLREVVAEVPNTSLADEARDCLRSAGL